MVLARSRSLTWTGSNIETLTTMGNSHRCAPDGTKVAFFRRSHYKVWDFWDIWAMDIDGSANIKITNFGIDPASTADASHSYNPSFLFDPTAPSWPSSTCRWTRPGHRTRSGGIYVSDIAGGGLRKVGGQAEDRSQQSFRPRWLTGGATTITGKVKDQSGDPVENVEVTAKGDDNGSDTTGADGSYSIDLPGKQGRYKVTPKLEDAEFKPKKRTVTVTPGETERVNFLMKGRVISGEVRLGCKGDQCSILPIAGVKVTAKEAGRRQGQEVLDQERRGRLLPDGCQEGQVPGQDREHRPDDEAEEADGQRQEGRAGQRRLQVLQAGHEGQASARAADQQLATSFECDDFVQVSYIAPDARIFFRWLSAPTCDGPDGPYIADRLHYVFGGKGSGRAGWETLDPGRGHYLENTGDVVNFIYPYEASSPPSAQFSGLLPVSGDQGSVFGDVSGEIKGESCAFSMEAANLYRQGGD